MTATTRLVGLALLLSLLVTSCTSASDPPEEGPVDLSDRPTMEAVQDRYKQMRDEMTVALAERFGERGWRTDPRHLGPLRSACGDDPQGEGEEVSFAPFSFTGTYPVGDWQDAVAVVREVGRRHGFTDERTLVDSPGDLLVYGEDDLGGSYDFGMAVNTVLTLRTGCHRWEQTPAPEPPAPTD